MGVVVFPLAPILAGLFGLLIGSFLNVCIYRWPRDLSVVKPRSACTACGHAIAWYDNVPLLSFAILRGRCRVCRVSIHWRYPLVELLNALCFAWFAWHGLDLKTAKYCVFSAILIGLIFSDLDTLILPDEFTIGGLVAGLAFAPFTEVPDETFRLICEIGGFRPGPRAGSFGEAAFGAFFPAAVLWLMGWLFEKIRHKEGLGFGDVKMIAMVGAFLGLQGALLTVIVGSVLGSVIGLAYIKLTGKDAATFQLPFATFLGVAALFAALRV
jgi:leader peptidase (prepilin peptidase)/N-methyltransferase